MHHNKRKYKDDKSQHFEYFKFINGENINMYTKID